MTYDTQLQQWVEHEHEQDVELTDHLTNRDNPHKVTPKQLGNDIAQWNAAKLQGIPVDLGYLKHGWAIAYNEKSNKFELFPLSDEKFFNHNKLAGYKENEHLPVDDNDINASKLWSSMRTFTEQMNLKNEMLQEQNKLAMLLTSTIEKLQDAQQTIDGGDFDNSDSGLIIECGNFNSKDTGFLLFGNF